jgi:hypothetical protein
MRIPVNTISTDENGNNLRINIASTAANDDWIRAARLLKEGKQEEYDKLSNTSMEIEI